MTMQSQRTKAVAETLNIGNEDLRMRTVREVNKISSHILSELRVPRMSEKDSGVLKFIQAMVAISPPSIQTKSGREFEFEQGLSSKPLMDIKRARNHNKAKSQLEKDSMFVVPKDQI